MPTTKTFRGEMLQIDTPNWEPLLAVVGDEAMGRFMWMCEIELSDGTLVQAYKHKDTRRYLHLSDDGVAYEYDGTQRRDRYRPIAMADALEEAFRRLAELRGVTGEEIAAAQAAIERHRA